MKIYIPTKGRVEKQKTYTSLPEPARQKATLVCCEDELPALTAKGYRAVAHPATVKGIAAVRQWICYKAAIYHKQIFMMDDDLEFYRVDQRASALAGKLVGRRVTDDDWGDLESLFARLFAQGYAMAGVAHQTQVFRLLGKSHTGTPTRMWNTYAVDLNRLRRAAIRWDAVPLMEDFHVNLSFLEQGQPTTLVSDFYHADLAVNAKGGCSEYRDQMLQNFAACELARLHPASVTLVKKTNSWAGGQMNGRTDVRVQWGKTLKNKGKLNG